MHPMPTPSRPSFRPLESLQFTAGRSMSRLSAWFRGLIADDPSPEYSRLDNMDGLDEWTVTPGGGLINKTAFDYMAHEMFGDRK